MAAADPGGPGPDLYQLLGVPREASRKDIAQAWRRRARAEHPDSRPGDATAPGRFRALAGAWHVLGDPRRRADYDRALAREQTPPPASWPPGPAVVTLAGQMPGSPPLWAGPVRVESPHRAPGPGWGDEEGPRAAVLAGLALRLLARDRDWPW
ncbi:MAG TPA: DnaJ domain-containing protein [Streptosporangiaceae bacterium]|nr:DnaJ domain-containing protein [Streptosporangiaceae bacterium]